MIVRSYIGIGANLGDALSTVQDVFRALDKIPGCRLKECSSLFRSAPINADGDDYINAVASIDTSLAPDALLDALQILEKDEGRVRSYANAPRTLDLDILLYGNQIIQTETLTVPHPRMAERAFVLIPLLQLAPAVNIPGLGEANTFLTSVAAQKIHAVAA
jgi:2-amino-4-hydroxy-6-hydroxymethyldihydropteridine diphosphokinase